MSVSRFWRAKFSFHIEYYIIYYSYIEIEYVAASFSPARTDLALKLLTHVEREKIICRMLAQSNQLYLAKMQEDQLEKWSYHLRDTMASESYKLQINDSCITSVMRKSTMEWQGLKHALESLILNFNCSV